MFIITILYSRDESFEEFCTKRFEAFNMAVEYILDKTRLVVKIGCSVAWGKHV